MTTDQNKQAIVQLSWVLGGKEKIQAQVPVSSNALLMCAAATDFSRKKVISLIQKKEGIFLSRLPALLMKLIRLKKSDSAFQALAALISQRQPNGNYRPALVKPIGQKPVQNEAGFPRTRGARQESDQGVVKTAAGAKPAEGINARSSLKQQL